MYDASIEKLLNTRKEYSITGGSQRATHDLTAEPCPVVASETGPAPEGCEDGFKYFPGTTTQTNPLFQILLPNNRHTPFSELEHANDLSAFLYDMFDNPFGGKGPEPAEHLVGWGMSANG
ncbi:hypothetical protein N7475_004260 [Penicillium sp. IBT 31633x]|nr:hypothetical protein N7475_004260 [Penicillium sp. IBT 31633x]